MDIQFNGYTMNKAAVFENGLEVIEQLGRLYVVKKSSVDLYKLFFNTGSFQQAICYASKM